MGLSNQQLKESIKNQTETLVNNALKEIDLSASIPEIFAQLEEIQDFLPVGGYIEHIFEKKYGTELKKVIWQVEVLDKLDSDDSQMPKYYYEQGFDKYWCCYDEPYLEYLDRGQDVNLINCLEGIIEEVENGGSYSDEIICLSNRRTKDVIKITTEQYCRDLIEWIIENKKSGFCFDW